MTELFHDTVGALITTVTAITDVLGLSQAFMLGFRKLALMVIHHKLICCGMRFASQREKKSSREVLEVVATVSCYLQSTVSDTVAAKYSS